MGLRQPGWKLGDWQGFNLPASCWDLIYSLLCSRKSFNPGAGMAGGQRAEGAVGGSFRNQALQFPVSPGKEGGSGILWDPLWLRGAAEAV